MIIDVTRVTQIDCTGLCTLENIVQIAKEAGVMEVAFTGASQEVRAALLRAPAADGGTRLFDNLDDSLMFYEDLLLGESPEGQNWRSCEPCPDVCQTKTGQPSKEQAATQSISQMVNC